MPLTGSGSPARDGHHRCAPCPPMASPSLQAAVHLLPLLSGPPLLHRAAVRSGRRGRAAGGPPPSLWALEGRRPAGEAAARAGRSVWLTCLSSSSFPPPPSVAWPSLPPTPRWRSRWSWPSCCGGSSSGWCPGSASGCRSRPRSSHWILCSARCGLGAGSPRPHPRPAEGLWAGWDSSGQAARLLRCPRPPTCTPAPSPGTLHAGSQGTLCHACFTPSLLPTVLGPSWALCHPSCCQCRPRLPTSALATPPDETP